MFRSHIPEGKWCTTRLLEQASAGRGPSEAGGRVSYGCGAEHGLSFYALSAYLSGQVWLAGI